MLAILFLSLLLKCNGDGAKVYREVGAQKFVHSASYQQQHNPHTPVSSEGLLKARSRVFRNVQVPLDGRVQRKLVAGGSIHNVANQSKDLSSPLFNYDEGNHHLNKLSEDKRVMEEAAEFAKGLERTTVGLRRDRERIVTTISPIVSSQSIPAIITPRIVTNDKKTQGKQTSSIFSQQFNAGRKQQDSVNDSASSQLGIRHVTPLILSFTVQTPHSQPNLHGLVHGFTPQIQSGIPPTAGTITVPKPPNQTIQLKSMAGLPTSIQFPQGQYPPILQGAAVPVVSPVPPLAGRRFTSPIPTSILQPNPPLPVQLQPPQVISGQAANSSLEQLGCGFDWLTNTCKDVFVIGWCAQCHDFGNIFVHDCKCVRPLITLPPRQPIQQAVLFNMI